MNDFSSHAFQVVNTLIAIIEKYNLLEKNPRAYGKGLTIYPSQIRAVVAIGNKPGINVTELAKLLDITKASVSELVGKLERNGLVRKTRDPGNNKEILLQITGACGAILSDVNKRHERIQQDIKSVLGELKETTCEAVIRVLSRFEYHLDEFLRESSGTLPAR